MSSQRCTRCPERRQLRTKETKAAGLCHLCLKQTDSRSVQHAKTVSSSRHSLKAQAQIVASSPIDQPEPIEDWSQIPPFHKGPITLRGWHVPDAYGSGLTSEAEEALGRDTLLGPGFYFGPEDAVSAYGTPRPVEVTISDPVVMWSPEESWEIETLDDLVDAFGYLPERGTGIVVPVANMFGSDEAQAVLFPGNEDSIRWLDE